MSRDPVELLDFDTLKFLVIVAVIVLGCGGCAWLGLVETTRDGKGLGALMAFLFLVSVPIGVSLYSKADARFCEGERGSGVTLMYFAAYALPLFFMCAGLRLQSPGAIGSTDYFDRPECGSGPQNPREGCP